MHTGQKSSHVGMGTYLEDSHSKGKGGEARKNGQNMNRDGLGAEPSEGGSRLGKENMEAASYKREENEERKTCRGRKKLLPNSRICACFISRVELSGTRRACPLAFYGFNFSFFLLFIGLFLLK